jgi:hypothetical protein
MSKVEKNKNKNSKHMELRETVRLASEVIAYYYPMGAFVHHNPLHGYEGLNFEDALECGKKLFGAKEFLDEEIFIDYLRTGRIISADLYELIDIALEKKGLTNSLTIAGKEVFPLDALKASFESNASAPAITIGSDSVEELFKLLAPSMGAYNLNEELERVSKEGVNSLGRELTISAWCDKVFLAEDESGITHRINTELIKWCEPFLDEGQADWAMPAKEKGLYETWRYIASKELSCLGIEGVAGKLASLPDRAEDCLAECLKALGVDDGMAQSYITLQLAALPGWAGYIKWREDQTDHDWQEAYPAYLVDFLAIRLWYEKELTSIACRNELNIDSSIDQIATYMRENSLDYFFKLERASGLLPSVFADEVDRIIFSGAAADTSWGAIKDGYFSEVSKLRTKDKINLYIKDILIFAKGLNISIGEILSSKAEDLKEVAAWMRSLSASERGLVWLKAFEKAYKDSLVGVLKENVKSKNKESFSERPTSQSVYCIDVRSEPFRRHLEEVGKNETFGFAGFFAVFMKFRALGSSHETNQFPVIVSAKNTAREIPRANQEDIIPKHRARGKLKKAGYNLLYDLKGDVITPYVMVESLGWLYCVPIFGKSWAAGWYGRAEKWFRSWWMPLLKTRITINKLDEKEAYGRLYYNQHIIIHRALEERFKSRGLSVSSEFVEYLRLRAMGEKAELCRSRFSEDEIVDFISELRENYRVNPRWAAASVGRIMQLGFTMEEQIATVSSSLKAMGLVKNFARIILFCAHGSTTENNPFEAALDCGACGGNSGHPNARVFVAMANNATVREALKKMDIIIPDDTYFIAGRHDTTTDEITIYDMEDLPSLHIEDLKSLKRDLLTAGQLNSQERCKRLPDVNEVLKAEKAWSIVKRKSTDWSQVRPEWGLSGNTAFIIGRRYLTRDTDLKGRVFLHSYDHGMDSDCKSLEAIMTAPQVVAQWINMEHYFSTVDNDVYGSGSKIYHNVTGRFAIMYGTHSDLRAGLPFQTVMDGDRPFHEPVRLTSIIEAPMKDIQKVIDKHPLLQNYYDKEWIFLISIDPKSGEFNRYVANKGWESY